MLKNKKFILGGTLFVAGAIVMAGTFAWFTDSEEVTNRFKLAKFDVSIEETFDKDANQNLEPGTETTKKVAIKNNGSVPAILRVKLNETLTEANVSEDANGVITIGEWPEGEDHTNEGVRGLTTSTTTDFNDPATTIKGRIDPRFLNVTDNLENLDTDADQQADAKWWYNETDGYFYYLAKLEAEATTENIIDKVVFSGNIKNDLMYANYTLTPVVEATQAKPEALRGEWGNNLEDLIKVLFPETVTSEEGKAE